MFVGCAFLVVGGFAITLATCGAGLPAVLCCDSVAVACFSAGITGISRISRNSDMDENGMNCRKFMESLLISFSIGLVSGIATGGISYTFSDVATVIISDELANLFDIGDIICDFVNSVSSSVTSDVIAMAVDEERVSGEEFALNIMKRTAKYMALTRGINFLLDMVDMCARQNDGNHLPMECQNVITELAKIMYVILDGILPDIYNSSDSCNR